MSQALLRVRAGVSGQPRQPPKCLSQQLNGYAMRSFRVAFETPVPTPPVCEDTAAVLSAD